MITVFSKFKALVKWRTPGRWHIGHINENLDRGEIESDGIIIASDCLRRDEAHLCLWGTHAGLIVDVLLAADAVPLYHPEHFEDDGIANLKAKLRVLRQALEKDLP